MHQARQDSVGVVMQLGVPYEPPEGAVPTDVVSQAGEGGHSVPSHEGDRA